MPGQLDLVTELVRGQLDLVIELALDNFDRLVDQGVDPDTAKQHAVQRTGVSLRQLNEALLIRHRAEMTG